MVSRIHAAFIMENMTLLFSLLSSNDFTRELGAESKLMGIPCISFKMNYTHNRLQNEHKNILISECY